MVRLSFLTLLDQLRNANRSPIVGAGQVKEFFFYLRPSCRFFAGLTVANYGSRMRLSVYVYGEAEMGQIMGKSMRFVIHVPLATGRRIISDSKELGMNEAAFVSASLALGALTLVRGVDMMRKATPAELEQMGQLMDAAQGMGLMRSRKVGKVAKKK
jgi:hypothetical protein